MNISKFFLALSKYVNNLLIIAVGIYITVYLSKKEKKFNKKRAMVLFVAGILMIIIGIAEFFIKF